MVADTRGFPVALLSSSEYAESSSGVSITGASEAAATTILTLKALYFDGNTRIRLIFNSYYSSSTAGGVLVFVLYDNGVVYSYSTVGGQQFSSAGTLYLPTTLIRTFTPPAGSHTFSMRAWKSGGTSDIVAPISMQISLAY